MPFQPVNVKRSSFTPVSVKKTTAQRAKEFGKGAAASIGKIGTGTVGLAGDIFAGGGASIYRGIGNVGGFLGANRLERHMDSLADQLQGSKRDFMETTGVNSTNRFLNKTITQGGKEAKAGALTAEVASFLLPATKIGSAGNALNKANTARKAGFVTRASNFTKNVVLPELALDSGLSAALDTTDNEERNTLLNAGFSLGGSLLAGTPFGRFFKRGRKQIGESIQGVTNQAYAPNVRTKPSEVEQILGKTLPKSNIPPVATKSGQYELPLKIGPTEADKTVADNLRDRLEKIRGNLRTTTGSARDDLINQIRGIENALNAKSFDDLIPQGADALRPFSDAVPAAVEDTGRVLARQQKLKALVREIAPVGDALNEAKNVFFNSGFLLRQGSQTAKNFADVLRQSNKFRLAKEIENGDFISNTLAKLDNDDKKRLFDALEGRISDAERSDALNTAVRELKTFFSEARSELVGRGVNVAEIKNYAPRILKTEYKDLIVDGKLLDFIKSVRKNDPNITEQEAKSIYAFLKKKARQNNLNLKSFFEFSRDPEFEKIPTSIFEKDPRKFLNVYSSEFSKRVVNAEIFGANNERVFDMIGTMLKENPKEALQALETLEEFLNPTVVSGRIKAIKSLEVFAKMGLSAITNIADLSITALRAGVWRTMSNAMRVLAGAGDDVKRAGGIIDSLDELSNSRLDQNNITGASKRFLDYAGFSATQKFADQVNLVSNKDYLNGLIKQYKKNRNNPLLVSRIKQIVGEDILNDVLRIGEIQKTKTSAIKNKTKLDMEMEKYESFDDFISSERTFFHGTPQKNVKKIKEAGGIGLIDGPRNQKGRISLSSNPSVSLDFATKTRDLSRKLPISERGEVFIVTLPEDAIGIGHRDVREMVNELASSKDFEFKYKDVQKRFSEARSKVDSYLKKNGYDFIDYRSKGNLTDDLLSFGRDNEEEIVLLSTSKLKNIGSTKDINSLRERFSELSNNKKGVKANKIESLIDAQILLDTRPMSILDIPLYFDKGFKGMATLMTQFQRYSYNIGNIVYRDIVEMMQKDPERALASLGNFVLAATITGEIVGKSKDYIKSFLRESGEALRDAYEGDSFSEIEDKFDVEGGLRRDGIIDAMLDPKKEDQFARMFASMSDSMLRAGGFGVATNWVEGIERAPYNPLGYGNIVAGPAISDLANLLDAGVKLKMAADLKVESTKQKSTKQKKKLEEKSNTKFKQAARTATSVVPLLKKPVQGILNPED